MKLERERQRELIGVDSRCADVAWPFLACQSAGNGFAATVSTILASTAQELCYLSQIGAGFLRVHVNCNQIVRMSLLIFLLAAEPEVNCER